MDGEKAAVGIIAVGALGLGAYYLLRKKTTDQHIQEVVDQIIAENPDISPEVAQVQAAEIVAEEALTQAQQEDEKREELDEMAAAVTTQAGTTQEAELAAIQALEEAKKAEAERVRIETEKKAAEEALKKAQEAADKLIANASEPVTVEAWAVSHETREKISAARSTRWNPGWLNTVTGEGIPSSAYVANSGTWQTEVDWVNESVERAKEYLAEQARIAAEEAARLEAERKAAAEEAARLEAARKAAEEAARRQAEEDARRRAELEALWRETLAAKEQDLSSAQSALETGKNAFNFVQSKVISKQNTINAHRTSASSVAYLYQDASWKGDRTSLPMGEYPNMHGWEVSGDQLSSLKVSAHYKVTCYENTNFGGDWIEFIAGSDLLKIEHLSSDYLKSAQVQASALDFQWDMSYLFRDKGWNDKVSAVKIAYDGRIEAEELQNLQIQLEQARNHLLGCKTSTNLLIEIVDRTAADVRLLGILNAEVDRLVSHNQAIRNLIANLGV